VLLTKPLRADLTNTHTPENIVRSDHKSITDYFKYFLGHDKIEAHFPVCFVKVVVNYFKSALSKSKAVLKALSRPNEGSVRALLGLC
jgi:hypothetical protein